MSLSIKTNHPNSKQGVNAISVVVLRLVILNLWQLGYWSRYSEQWGSVISNYVFCLFNDIIQYSEPVPLIDLFYIKKLLIICNKGTFIHGNFYQKAINKLTFQVRVWYLAHTFCSCLSAEATFLYESVFVYSSWAVWRYGAFIHNHIHQNK